MIFDDYKVGTLVTHTGTSGPNFPRPYVGVVIEIGKTSSYRSNSGNEPAIWIKWFKIFWFNYETIGIIFDNNFSTLNQIKILEQTR